MRRLVRPRISPPTLVKIRRDYPFTSAGEAEFPPGKWNNPDVRGALYAIGGRVCAYCGRLASDNRGDVEHYRPKSIYPWLTYEFTNYLIGCRICNTSRKSNEFPLLPLSRRLRYSDQFFANTDNLQEALARERRLLLDPVNDPVDEWVDVEDEETIARVCPSTVAATNSTALRIVEETIDFFGVNILVDLVTERDTQIQAALIALRKWKEGDASKADDVRALSNRYIPHGWAVRKVVQRLASTLKLPSAQDDLKWLVEQTINYLKKSDVILAKPMQPKDRELAESRKEEACWTLAALWKDPPAADSSAVKEWIIVGGRRAEIEPFVDRL